MRPLLALAFVLAIGETSAAQNGQAAIIVEVNGEPITRADLDVALAMDDKWNELIRQGQSAGYTELRKAYEGRVLESLIDEILLAEAAKTARIRLTPEEEREVARLFEERVEQDWGSVGALEEEMRRRGLPPEKLRARHRLTFIVRKLLAEEGRGASFVRPAEIREYYEAHLESYRLPGRVEVAQILVRKDGRAAAEARQRIEAAAKALAEGKAFADVVKDYPDSPNYDRGGVLPAPSISAYAEDLRKILQSLKPGETSGILETPRIYRIVRLVRLSEDRFQPFEEVQDKIYEVLEDRARFERLQQLKARLREKAFVKRKPAP